MFLCQYLYSLTVLSCAVPYMFFGIMAQVSLLLLYALAAK